MDNVNFLIPHFINCPENVKLVFNVFSIRRNQHLYVSKKPRELFNIISIPSVYQQINSNKRDHFNDT